ncbi:MULTISPECIES: hypothetical protein [Clostridium]|uniref:Transcriptional regulator, TrmB n=1 Tax=Clostridium carnis TaxID=1530 RepID=A0ABY6SRI6_9CLOT|nr:hypothetical protein [Clostridium carnis]CAI3543072.1 Transcriptional regulator, TrmB [Clostridium neonatale]CAI3561716.1 Transcriptional regulator, TrmB [Clostridium neonatale]CAI3562959.1 Transcriptional regulator, TrmB [Clostridium neonatale]CAI3583964.1 Transcriptional regulator, TrmB [Clostridium neonatale]CAI3623671.1 Transcriptional regulator, TrmB [Clostridium neonatale]
MKWAKVREQYPNSWVVFDSLEEHEENNILYVEDIAIIEVFNDLNDAYKLYRTLHRQDKNRKLSLGDTRKDSLQYEIKRIGLVR